MPRTICKQILSAKLVRQHKVKVEKGAILRCSSEFELPFFSVFTIRVGRGVVGPVEVILGVVMFISNKI